MWVGGLVFFGGLLIVGCWFLQVGFGLCSLYDDQRYMERISCRTGGLRMVKCLNAGMIRCVLESERKKKVKLAIGRVDTLGRRLRPDDGQYTTFPLCCARGMNYAGRQDESRCLGSVSLTI
jgi:hypothetical protein